MRRLLGLSGLLLLLLVVACRQAAVEPVEETVPAAAEATVTTLPTLPPATPTQDGAADVSEAADASTAPETEATDATAEGSVEDSSADTEPIVNIPEDVMTSPTIARLAQATVHVALLDEDYNIIGFGSGTIISRDGLILTNAHVAQPSALDRRAEDPAFIGIELLEREDEPPVPTFFASVAAVDGLLDLAVLQIDSFLDGSPFRPAEFTLPTVAIGNSDEVHLGDDVRILGYPGIGGDTITFTQGKVAGFSPQAQVGNRAWIKTDATIAGGNSGGLAVDDRGYLIGVPTQASAGEGVQVTDCRVVQDTNGDGRLNSSDNCIPIGGFINALRPINLALPLIEAVQMDVAYNAPREPEDATGVVVARGAFMLNTWAEDFDRRGCPVNAVVTYPEGASRVVAVFDWQNVASGTSIAYRWEIDTELVANGSVSWDGENTGSCFPFWLENQGQAMPNGSYALTVVVGEQDPVIVTAETTVGSAGGAQRLLQLEGSITDVANGRPIPGAAIILLAPGVNVESWMADPVYDQIFTSAEADARGFYQLPDLLQRNVRYEAVVIADGYAAETGYVEFDEDAAEIVVVDIALTR